MPFAVEQALAAQQFESRLDLVAEGGVGVHRAQRIAAVRGHRRIPRLDAFEHVGAVHREIHRQRTARHLRIDPMSTCASLVHLRDLAEHVVGRGIAVEHRGDQHRPA
ncbi:MAG TPA: hypothetical protein PKA20_09925, partial [Burkholderiaceae bacterium]|nr:hypothetical protein [Burkholderiaceae bacterium]